MDCACWHTFGPVFVSSLQGFDPGSIAEQDQIFWFQGIPGLLVTLILRLLFAVVCLSNDSRVMHGGGAMRRKSESALDSVRRRMGGFA